jgi:hypothetical protein
LRGDVLEQIVGIQLMTNWHRNIQSLGYRAAEIALGAAAIVTVVVIAKDAL